MTPRPIVQVLDNDGYAVLNRPVQRTLVLSEAVAYQMVSMLLNTDRYPLPEGTQPELKPLK